MPDPSGLGLIALFGDLVKALKSIKGISNSVEIGRHVSEAYDLVIAGQVAAAQSNNQKAALAEEIRELKEELTTLKAWAAQKQRYHLATTEAGAMVYALKTSMSEGQPAHYVCTRCYEDGKCRVLQIAPSKRNSQAYAFVCPVCASEAMNGYSGPSDAKFWDDAPK